MNSENRREIEEIVTVILEEDKEKETAEEIISNIIDASLYCVDVRVTGKIIRKAENGTSIIVETEKGEAVEIDINDGITDSEVFQIGDQLTGLLLSGAYLKTGSQKLTFIFTSPQAE